ncbi:MAG TPA: site-specific integrase [Terrimicrobiaceae bacterium]
MPCLYRRKGSPFWWLKYQKDGATKCESTGLRYEDETQTAQAEVIRAKWALRENNDRGHTGQGFAQQSFDWSWVDKWLDSHCKSQRTRAAYDLRWRHIQHWLAYSGIRHPRDISYRHGHDYVSWRSGRRAGHKICSKNTALTAVKLLGQVLRECALRGFIDASPIQRLGISRDEPEPKRELSDSEIVNCLEALNGEKEWMRLSFLIALHTGCRLRETRIRLALVDFERKTITFENPKGGRTRGFTRPLPVALEPILRPLIGREFTHDFPSQPSRCFQNFFRRVGVRGVSFHTLRVSYVTRLHRAGVPLSAAMRLVNHSSEAVHRIYQRLNVDDVRPYAEAHVSAGSNSVRSESFLPEKTERGCSPSRSCE